MMTTDSLTGGQVPEKKTPELLFFLVAVFWTLWPQLIVRFDEGLDAVAAAAAAAAVVAAVAVAAADRMIHRLIRAASSQNIIRIRSR